MKPFRKLSAACAGAALAAALATAPAAAAVIPIGYTLQGQVDDDEAGRGWASFAATLVFDAAAVDPIADPSTAAYPHAGAPWGLTLTLDDGTQQGFGTALQVLVSNDLADGDHWGVLAQQGAETLSLELLDPSGSVFADDTLQRAAAGLMLADFGWTTLRWEGAAGVLQGHLTSLACSSGCPGSTGDPGIPPTDRQPVPEPGTLALAALGLALGQRVRSAR